jgi:hypothetical protein
MKTAEEILDEEIENSSEYSEITIGEREIIITAMKRYAEQLNKPCVSDNEMSLIEPLRNFIRSKHLSKEWEIFLEEYQRNQ